jgi:hypothetical protein
MTWDYYDRMTTEYHAPEDLEARAAERDEKEFYNELKADEKRLRGLNEKDFAMPSKIERWCYDNPLTVMTVVSVLAVLGIIYTIYKYG